MQRPVSTYRRGGDRVMLQDAATIMIVMLLLLGLCYLISWLVARKKFIDQCNLLPGPPLSGTCWLAHLKPFVDTINTVPGYPGIPRTLDVYLQMTRSSSTYNRSGFFRYWVFHPYCVPFARCEIVLWDPTLVRQFLLLLDQQHHYKEPRLYGMAAPLIGTQSVLSLPDGPRWKHQRKLIARGLQLDLLELANDVAVELLCDKAFVAIDRQLQQATPHVTIEMAWWSVRMASEILGRVAFSYSFGSMDEPDNDEALFGVYQRLLWTVGRRLRALPLMSYFRFQENREFDCNLRLLDQVVDKVVAERLGDTQKTNKHRDLLSYMLQADDTQDGGDKLSHQELRDNVKMFMFAGQDTTATALAFGLWELAQNGHIQEKLRTEVDALFGDSLGQPYPSYQDIMKLKYLDAVVKETLRIYAPVFVARRVKKDITMTTREKVSFTIPKNATVFVSPSLSQRQRIVFSDQPDQWMPERFLGDDSKGSLANWFPFSVGPRNCVGQPLALVELKTILTHMVRNYKLRPSSQMEEDPIPIVLLTVKPHQVLLDIYKR